MQKKYFITEYLSSVTLCIPGLWASHALSKGGPMTPHLVCLEQGAGLSQVWWGAASPPLPPPRALQHLGLNDPLSFLPPRPSSSPRSEPPAPLPQLSTLH